MRRFVPLALALLFVLVAAAPSQAICPTGLAANQTCIDQPPVNAPTTLMSTTFPAGSHVTLHADGCERWGADHPTWSRYVNPDPPAGAPNRHGLVAILSTTGQASPLPLSRFLNVDNTTVRVTSPSRLQLGFEDTVFTDNGYTDFDTGTGNQCSDASTGPLGHYYGPWGYGGPAYVLLTVVPNRAPAVAISAPAAGALLRGAVTLGTTTSDGDGDAVSVGYLVDDQPLAGGSASWDTSRVADGTHLLKATASDGYATTTAASILVRVDNSPPEVAIGAGPDGQTFAGGTTLTWTFTAVDGTSGVAAIRCSVDGGPFGACSGPDHETVSGLANGAHRVAIEATDVAGNTSAPASRAFAIDSAPPETTIGAGPADGAETRDTSISYGFTSSEPGSTFQCRDYTAAPPAFRACSGPDSDRLRDLAAGDHVFEVRATDAFGNVDPTPAKRTVTIVSTSSSGGGPDPVGGGEPHPAPPITLSFLYHAKHAYTRFTKLRVQSIPRGSTVTVTCAGGGCPKGLRGAGYTKRDAAGALSLARFITHRFKVGAVLKVVVSKPNWIGVVKTLTVRSSHAPRASTRCLPPGQSRPAACD